MLGLPIDAVFLVPLAALPWRRSVAVAIPLFLAMVSPAVIFAMERGNQDLIIFVLIIVGIVLLEQPFTARMLGYSSILLAALLKFYPLVLLIVLLRENPRTALWLIVAAIAIIVGVAWNFQAEFYAALANIPMPPTFIPGFGAGRLPHGVGVMLSKFGIAPSASIVQSVSFLVLAISACTLAIKLASASAFRSAFDRLTTRETLCLVSGAALICGCFFTGTSSLYRGVLFLLVLPGLVALAHLSSSKTVGRMVRATTWLTLSLLFSLPVGRLVDRLFGRVQLPDAPLMTLIYWLVCELAWWWIAAMLSAILIYFVLVSLSHCHTRSLRGTNPGRCSPGCLPPSIRHQSFLSRKPDPMHWSACSTVWRFSRLPPTVADRRNAGYGFGRGWHYLFVRRSPHSWRIIRRCCSSRRASRRSD